VDPIFVVCANGDILAFDSVDAAQRALESPDVESGEYVGAFDAAGTQLRIHLEEPTRRTRFLGVASLQLTPVTIEPFGEPGAGSHELRRLLVERLGEPVDVPLAALEHRAHRELRSE
jgi:hypothetical protein